MNASRDYTITSVKRALDILKLFNDQRIELTLSEISELSGIGKSSILRFLYTLRNEDFIAYDEETKKYSLGVEMYRLGITKYSSLDLRKIAGRHLQRLSDETGMICYLSVREKDKLIMLDQLLPSNAPVWTQLVNRPGGSNELYSTGNGRLILSQDTDEDVMAYLNRVELKKFTDATITDKNVLLELVRQARRDGYSGNIGENEPHVYSLCAPIYNRVGQIVAACSICGMKDIICSDDYDHYLSKICGAAKRISFEMGYKE